MPKPVQSADRAHQSCKGLKLRGGHIYREDVVANRRSQEYGQDVIRDSQGARSTAGGAALSNSNRADVTRNEAFNNASEHNQRTLSGLIAHERTHTLLNRHFGVIKSLFAPAWKKEGFCDFVAEETSFDRAEDIELLKENREEGSGSFRYFKYYLAVKYLREVKRLSVDEIFSRDFDLGDLQRQAVRSFCSAASIVTRKTVSSACLIHSCDGHMIQTWEGFYGDPRL